MDITPRSLNEKLSKLPRLARIRFLYICCDRVAPLFYAKCARLLLNSINFGKSPFERVLAIVEIAGKYSFNPYLYTRVDLERAKEDGSSLEGVAFGSSCGDHPFMVAWALQDLMKCCINVPEKPEDDPYSDCFLGCYRLMVGSCLTDKGMEMIHRQLNSDLDAFTAAALEHKWTDDSPPRGAVVFPGWTLGTPDGWPTTASVAFYSQGLIDAAKRLPFGLLGKLFK